MRRGFVAIDLGAESGRHMVVTLADGTVTLQQVHRFEHVPVQLPTGLHWDVTGLWLEIVRGLRHTAQWAEQNDVQLVSVGVDTWGVDWALVSQSGQLLGLPPAYRDPMNVAAYESAVEKLGVERLYQTTGIQLMPINSLFSLAARLQHSPELFAAADHLLFIPDLFHYWLTGKMRVEATIASTSQMTDCHTGDWAGKLIAKLGLPVKILPDLTPPGTILGNLRADVLRATELPASLQVALPASHDTASAVAAVPAAKQGSWCYISSGTWSLLGAELDEPCVSDEAREAMFTNELGAGGRIRFLKNITGLWLVQQCRQDLLRQGIDLDYGQLTDQAAQAESFRTLINPDAAGFQTAGDMLDKIRRFTADTNQPQPETPGEFVRCCLESLAFAYRHTLEELEKVLSTSFAVIHIVGGGGQNLLLNQLTADATGKSIRVGPYEATALGNALMQAISYGDVRDLEHLRGIVAESFPVESYEPSGMFVAEAYQRFLRFIKQTA